MKEDKHWESFLDPTNDYEKCVKEIEESIPKVVKENPGITTREVLDRQMANMRKWFFLPPEKALRAFNEALANNLGTTIQCLGKTKTIEGRKYQQLKLFEA